MAQQYIPLPKAKEEAFGRLVKIINNNGHQLTSKLLAEDPELVSYLDMTGKFLTIPGNNLLQYALTKPNHVACFERILTATKAQNLDLNYIVESKVWCVSNTPLMLSIKTGAYHQALSLLKMGVNPNIKSTLGGFAPLHILCFKVLNEIGEEYKQQVKDKSGLYQSIEDYFEDLLKGFTKNKADFFIEDSFHNQPYDLLIKKIHPDDTRKYIQKQDGKALTFTELKTKYNIEDDETAANHVASLIKFRTLEPMYGKSGDDCYDALSESLRQHDYDNVSISKKIECRFNEYKKFTNTDNHIVSKYSEMLYEYAEQTNTLTSNEQNIITDEVSFAEDLAYAAKLQAEFDQLNSDFEFALKLQGNFEA